ncbi:hypothetical protein ACLEBZ_15865 [Escherichia coli]
MNEVYCLRSLSLASHALSGFPASPAQLTFSITDNQPGICSLVIFSKHIAVSCFDGNSLFA